MNMKHTVPFYFMSKAQCKTTTNKHYIELMSPYFFTVLMGLTVHLDYNKIVSNIIRKYGI